MFLSFLLSRLSHFDSHYNFFLSFFFLSFFLSFFLECFILCNIVGFFLRRLSCFDSNYNFFLSFFLSFFQTYLQFNILLTEIAFKKIQLIYSSTSEFFALNLHRLYIFNFSQNFPRITPIFHTNTKCQYY